MALVAAVCLCSFSLDKLSELILIVSSSIPSMCVLDPIPTKLFKQVLPSLNAYVFDVLNLYLLTAYTSQAFKVEANKP